MTGLGQVGALGRLGAPALARGGWWLSGSELDLDFANNRAFNRSTGFNGSPNGILTYTSPSPKLVYGNDGVLTYAPHNLFTYSEQFDNAAWTKTASSITANSVAAPDGTTTADTLTADAGTGIIPRFADVNVITANGAVHTASIYAKAGTYSFVQFYLINQGAEWVNFTLSGSGTVSANGSCTATITALSGGWYRLTMTYTAGSTDRRPFFMLAPSGTATRAQSWNPAGTESVYFWGAQLNLGSSAFTYIPTTSAAVYSLPIDHDPITHEPLGVLIEEQRTNLLLRSQELGTSPWASSGVGGTTVTVNTSTAPDGTTTADTVTFGASNTAYRFQALTFAASTAYTMSVWAKTASGTKAFRFKLFDGSANPISGDQTATTAWQRFTYSFTSAAGAGVGDLGLVNETAGTAGDVIFWGAQIEAGAFPTSYIPTVASQVTRAADQVSILTSAFAFNAAEGTMLGWGTTETLNSALGNLVQAADSGNNRIAQYVGSSYLGLIVTDASVNQAVLNPATTNDSTFKKVASGYKANDFAVSLNGGSAQTDVAGTVPTVDTLRFGRQSTVYLNGHIKRLTYFPTRKTNAELQALTA